jgi:hypothetical protein
MKALLILGILLPTKLLFSQNLTNYGQTNTAGIYGTLSNPALAAGSIDYLSINLAGAGLTLENNLIHSKLKYSSYQIATLQYKRDQQPHHSPPYFEIAPKKGTKPSFYLNTQVLLPSVKFNLTPKIAAYIYARERVTGNVVEVAESVMPMFTDRKSPYVPKGGADYKTDIRILGYREVAAGLSLVVYDRREARVKVGVTAKQITARFAYVFNVAQFEANVATNEINILSRYRMINTDVDGLTQNPASFALGTASAGTGMGFDAGIVYEHRPYRLRNRYTVLNPKGRNKNFRQRDLIKYDYRIGAALLDWGRVELSNKHTKDRVLETQSSFDLRKTPTPEEYQRELKKNERVLSEQNNTVLNLPAVLMLTGDYRINRQWFVNVSYAQNLRSTKKAENFYAPTAINALLRKEMEHITYGIPLRIVPRTSTVTMGGFIQAGPFFAGTDNILTFFNRKMYNPSVYAGLCYTIKYKKDPTIETFKNFGQF